VATAAAIVVAAAAAAVVGVDLQQLETFGRLRSGLAVGSLVESQTFEAWKVRMAL